MIPASKSIGKILSIFLVATIIFGAIALINTYFIFYHQNLFQNIITFDYFISFSFLGINIIASIIYLVWIYKIHIDLNQLSIQYPISPSGAIFRIIIPLYNLWGMWNVYSTMAKHLETRFLTNFLAQRLSMYVPIFYITFIVSRVLDRAATNSTSGILWLVSWAGDLFLFIVYLLMVKTITQAIQIISGDIEKEEIQVENETTIIVEPTLESDFQKI